MTTIDPHYSPLLQGDWSEEEGDGEGQGMLSSDRPGPDRDVERKGGLPFPQPYRHNRKSQNSVPPLYVFLAVIGVISAGTFIAVIAGVIRSHVSEPASQSHIHNSPSVGQVKTNLTSSSATTVTGPTVKPATPTAKSMTTSLPVTSKPLPKKVKLKPAAQPSVQATGNWRVVLNNTGAESCVRTPDIDGDGLPDVLFGLAHGVDLSLVSSLDEGNSLKKYCEKKHLPYPCVGFLLALRGMDGKELWRVPTRSEVMFMMCDIDLNGDGAKDCIATGRQSTIQAVDLRKGKTLWYADGSEYASHFTQMWNVYQAVPLPDVDGDGVDDIVVAHGGDPNIDAEIHEREAGRLIVLSGATGRPFGDFIEMPNSKETYMTPVMYTDTDGSQYLMFGSGGETVPGDLMAMTLTDLLTATNQKTELDLKGNYRWKEHLYPESGIMTLYQGKEKGVMVPPVIVDIDNDGVQDILVSVFEGKMVMMDGQTLKPKWEKNFPNSESYSTPAPGYYDEDEYLDFMVHWSEGEWPTYNESTVFIVSGKDGSILWEDGRPLYVMSSDLVLRSQEDRFDYFVVKMRGKPSDVGNHVWSEAHGIGAQRNISKRDANHEDFLKTCAGLKVEFEKHHVSCDKNLTNLGEGVVLVDRNKHKNFPHLHELSGERFYYGYKEREEMSCVPVDKETGMANMCAVTLPESRSTDAVTDVDNDGRLDLINVGVLEGRLRDARYSYTEMKFTTIISRIDIETAIHGKATNNQDTGTAKQPKFAPLTSQPWLQYLGSEVSSVYHQNGH